MQSHIVGGYEEAEGHVGGAQEVLEGLEINLEG